MKLRSKFNLGFTYDSCVHFAILKTLYNFKVKISQRGKRFFFQNVQKRHSRELPLELTLKLATETTTPHS